VKLFAFLLATLPTLALAADPAPFKNQVHCQMSETLEPKVGEKTIRTHEFDFAAYEGQDDGLGLQKWDATLLPQMKVNFMVDAGALGKVPGLFAFSSVTDGEKNVISASNLFLTYREDRPREFAVGYNASMHTYSRFSERGRETLMVDCYLNR